ncbi:hypothetical protein SANA_07810 [Gottschalkiaceae bacterium SANA]|nr:hypothetical protein SANA_07810 [Gottschalkiaceae bacterium SANA]
MNPNISILKYLRETNNMQVNDFVKILRTSKSEVFKYLSGVKLIRNRHKDVLSDYFNIDRVYLERGNYTHDEVDAMKNQGIGVLVKENGMKDYEKVLELTSFDKKTDKLEKEKQQPKTPIKIKENETIVKTYIKSDSNIGSKCELVDLLQKLRQSSKEAVEGIEEFSEFKEYMHVERQVERELIEKLSVIKSAGKSKQLFFVCGSVGDGKSHVLSQIKNRRPDLLAGYKIHNDATESNNPKKSYKQILDALFDPFSDKRIHEEGDDKLIVAINLGTLSNFIEDKDYRDKYTKIKQYIDKNKIIEDLIVEVIENEVIDYVSFSDYSIYELTSEGPVSAFMDEIIEKITVGKMENPFHNAFKTGCEICTNKNYCPVKRNYEMMEKLTIKNEMINLIIEAIIKFKVIISVRFLMDFFYKCLVPSEFEALYDSENLDKMDTIIFNDDNYWKFFLPNILFESKTHSPLFNSLSTIDPINERIEDLDEIIINFNISSNKLNTLKEIFNKPEYDLLNNAFNDKYLYIIDKENLSIICRSYIRFARLIGDEIIQDRRLYRRYTQELFSYNTNRIKKLESFYARIISAIYKWNGIAGKNWINIDNNSNNREFLISEELKIVPSISLENDVNEEDLIWKFETSIKIRLKNDVGTELVEFIVDYDLYEMLDRVNKGFRLNHKDQQNYISFIDSISKLIEQGGKAKQVKIIYKAKKNLKEFYLKKNEFGGYLFE